MQRFLTILGILLTAGLFFEYRKDIWPTSPTDDTGNRANAAAVSAVGSGVSQVQPKHAITSPAKVANRATAGTALAGADIRSDEEYVEPSQMLSSARLEVTPIEIRPSIILLTPFEMKSAVQTELSRLSCYNAEIDGLWGRKSRAAVEAYNAKSNNIFDLEASGELLTTLKDEPDGLCLKACDGPDGACSSVATLEVGPVNADSQSKKEAPSYLPPWMVGKKLTVTEPNTDPPSAAEGSSSKRPSYRKPSAYQAKKTKKKRRSARVIRKSQRRRTTDWLPDNWPGRN